MARFQNDNTRNSRNLVSGIVLFIIIIALFCWCISSISSGSDKRQRETLENSIMRSIANCYALEGEYPESLEYIKENYGLVYDEDRFFVDYRVSGSNIMPDVTIIDIKEQAL